MNNGIDNRCEYVAFEIKNHTFAVPMKDTLGIVAGGHNTTYTILPKEQKKVKCIVDLEGLLVTVVNIPGTCEDLQIIGNYIVLLEHLGRNIGIVATKTHLVRVLENSILEDKITGQKSFILNGKTYLKLDISQLYRELGI